MGAARFHQSPAGGGSGAAATVPRRTGWSGSQRRDPRTGTQTQACTCEHEPTHVTQNIERTTREWIVDARNMCAGVCVCACERAVR